MNKWLRILNKIEKHKRMDLLRDDGASIEEDRISNLPDDIIHRILSFLDMRYSVRTCILSHRWKNTWTSMPYINLNSHMFKSSLEFEKFVKHVLTQFRKNRTEVFEIELRFDDETDVICVEDIATYAYLHNARALTMIFSSTRATELRPYVLSDQIIKHLILDGGDELRNLKARYLPDWEFSALETLKLSNVRLDYPGDESVHPFSKCVNLKDLTLHGIHMHGRKIFNLCAPQLLNLTIIDFASFPVVFNVVAPQLKNLTASLTTYPFVYGNRPPLFLPLSADGGGFNSLEKVNLSFGPGRKEQRHNGSQLFNLFQIICKAKFLNLDVDIIEDLSNSWLDQLSCEPCPFNNLKCLKINNAAKPPPLKQNKRSSIATLILPIQIGKYFLQNSPSATFIVLDYHQVPRKRSRDPQVAKLVRCFWCRSSSCAKSFFCQCGHILKPCFGY